MNTILDVVVVGAGQAGLGMACLLQQAGHSYVVLERGQVGETWRAQRWDSFALNTPNWGNTLPGLPYDGPQPDGFWRREELVAYFERYAQHFDLAVRTGVDVTAVEASSEGTFTVRAQDGQDGELRLQARSVVVASGIMQTPKIPAIHHKLPAGILQLHTATYDNPDQVPTGAVVVVGSGQSGCQIVEDLLAAGREVYLCTSKVGRVPRRYRGREILEWWRDSGFFSQPLEELSDPSVVNMRQPQVSGTGRFGHTVSLQQLAREGATILGTLRDVSDGTLILVDNAAEHVAFADALSAKVKQDIDDYLTRAGLELPPLVDDPADEPDPDFACVTHLERLDLAAAGVSTVIWATGFTASFDWLHLPVLDDRGVPQHTRGVSGVPGIYFLGFPWLHRRNSGVIMGIEDDAKYLAKVIGERLA